MQKLKNQILKSVSAFVIGLAVLFSGALALAPAAGALDCSILPQSICNSADQQSTGTASDPNAAVKQNPIFNLLKLVLQIMTAGIGVAAVGGIVYAAVLYTSAGDAMDQVKKAKTIITDVVIGLVAYALMFLVLNWLIPGGVFG